MVEETSIFTVDQLGDETRAWLQEQGFQTLGTLANLSASILRALPGFEDRFLWEVQDALESRGLELRIEPPPEFDARLGVLTLDEWVRRLASTCPHAAELTSERVRVALTQSHFDMSVFDMRLPPGHYKCVLYALAQEQRSWLYASDWKGSRDQAAEPVNVNETPVCCI